MTDNPEFNQCCPKCKGCDTVESPPTQHDDHLCKTVSCRYCGYAGWVCKVEEVK